MARWRPLHILGAGIGLLIFAAALVALHHILIEVNLADVRNAISGLSPWKIGLSILSAAGSYLMLTGYDVLALRQLGKRIPYIRAAFAAFMSYAISHTVGLSVLTGGSVRYRIYSPIGLTAAEIVRLTTICALTFGLAVTFILGLALILEPVAISRIDQLPSGLNLTFGAITLAALVAYTAWIASASRKIVFRDWELELPGLQATLIQFALGACDLLLAATALYVLLPQQADIGFFPFAGLFIATITLSFLSHIPGGVGVLEAMILLALPDIPPDQLLASLLVFRVVYYLLPFTIAATLMGGFEAAKNSRVTTAVAASLEPLVRTLAPLVMGSLVLVAGAILLFSGATPALTARLHIVSSWLPVSLVEFSHLTGSVAGVLLVILARGLYRRLDGAWHLTLGLLVLGMFASIAKGFDYEEALVLAGVALLLYLSRDAFYRKSSLLNQSFSTGWTLMLLAILALSVAIGIFAFKHVEYSNELWWQFTYRSDVSRFLRASFASAVVALGFVTLRLLRAARPASEPRGAIPDTVRSLVAVSRRADATLALTGDKRFLISDDGDAFIMYGVYGHSWVALGDPIGAPAAFHSLLWRFREMIDVHDGLPAFYQIGPDYQTHYLDMGLSLTKLGEMAHVDLSTFSLEGSSRKDLRRALRRAEREQMTFEVLPAGQVRQMMPTIRAISDAWLTEKSTAEKGFSVGFFNEEYIGGCDCAVVTQGDKPVAFANLLYGAEKTELSIDLMRHLGSAPHGTMDFLFGQLMLWGKEKGYRKFGLGMSPLAGLESHPLAPTWAQVGTIIFRHGEHFYNFEGLRAYKEKFQPEWSPCYLASQGGIALPRVLFDIAALIGGGISRVLTRGRR